MISELSRELLGKYGTIILDFYLNHQMVINTIIVLYGILLILIKRKKIRKAEQNREKTETKIVS